MVKFGISLIALVGYGTSLFLLFHAIWAYIDHWRAYLNKNKSVEKQEIAKFINGVAGSMTAAFITVIAVCFLTGITNTN